MVSHVINLSEKNRKRLAASRERRLEIEGSIEEHNERIARIQKDPEIIKLINQPPNRLRFFQDMERAYRAGGGSVDYLGGPEQYIKDRDAFMKANGITDLFG